MGLLIEYIDLVINTLKQVYDLNAEEGALMGVANDTGMLRTLIYG